MKKNIIISAFLSLGLIFFYQNCGKQKFNFDPLLTVNRIEGGECVPGKKLSIYFDDANQTYIGDVVSYTGDISSTSNYGYSSASAHPVNGPDPIGYEIHNYFYEGTDGLTLAFYGNIDSNDASQGSSDNQYSLTITTTKNDGVDKVIFIDDPNAAPSDYIDYQKLSDRNEYDAHFHYWYNTDGAVIGPFNSDDFEIRVKITSAGDLKGARFYSSNGGSFNLGLSGILSYVIKYREYEDCSN